MTQATLDQIQDKVGNLTTPDTSLVLYGSLARREFTPDSDADWSCEPGYDLGDRTDLHVDGGRGAIE